MRIPEEFEKRMEKLLGEEYPAFRASLDAEASAGLRINLCKRRAESAAFLEKQFSLQEVPWCGSGYTYDREEHPGKHALHEAGAYYIQEPSAMSAAEVAGAAMRMCFGEEETKRGDDPEEGDAVLRKMPSLRVLDLCAAPGGKSTQLAGFLAGKGLLWSNEFHPQRAAILSQNIERMGIANAIVSNETTARLAERLPGFFDCVLVDAPCSGEGMFRKSEDAVNDWSLETVALCAARQREILKDADRCLKPGGLLIYSTCTFAPEECEGQIADFVAARGEEGTEYDLLDMSGEKPQNREYTFGECFEAGKPEWAERIKTATSETATLGAATSEAATPENATPGTATLSRDALSRTMRLLPHHLNGEGHFVAALRKSGDWEAEGEDSYALADTRQASDRQKTSGKAGKKGKPGKSGKAGKAGKSKTLPPEAEDLLTEVFSEKGKSFLAGRKPIFFGEQIYLAPGETPDLEGLKILRPGLHLGTQKPGRMEPSHALALALGQEDVRHRVDLPATSDEAAAFLRGEALPSDGSRGWVLICADGYSLGWGKSDGRLIKNHLPKGLRKDIG